MARPVRGSRLRLFMRLRAASGVAAAEDEASDPSDLAFTKRSDPGSRFWSDPPRIFYVERKINMVSFNYSLQ